MFSNGLIIGILVFLLGIAFCFAGYRFFRILIAAWGFLTGFLLTTQVFAITSGGHLLLSAVGLIIAVIVGLVLAALAYALYVAAVVILSASVGFWIGTGLMNTIGYTGGLVLLVGIIFAVLLAILTLTLNLTKILIIIITALGGAGAIVIGGLLLFNVIPLAALSLGIVGAIIRVSSLWGLAWLMFAMIGVSVQLNRTQRYAPGYAQSQF